MAEPGPAPQTAETDERSRRQLEALQRVERARKARPRVLESHVTLAHGAGGKASHTLVQDVFLDAFGNPLLGRLEDGAVLAAPGLDGRLVFTTDSFVVSPLWFPGGDIGKLAVHGTVNDLAVSGARPLALAAAFILEEGLPVEELRRVARSVGEAAAAAGVPVVAGDTKVVERGKADRLFITTAGVGLRPPGLELGPERMRPGDRLLLSGAIAEHGLAILTARGDLALEADVASDTAPLHGLVAAMLAAAPPGAVRVMRDPTRGGLATVANELAAASGLGIVLDEAAIPVRAPVRGACEILGIDPLYVANEGKLVAVVAPEAAGSVLAAMRAHPLGRDACDIGEVRSEPAGVVAMRTAVGGTRMVDVLIGDPLPRIC